MKTPNTILNNMNRRTSAAVRSRHRTPVAIATILGVAVCASASFGQTFTPTSGTGLLYNTASNFNPSTVPNSVGATVTFSPSTATETVSTGTTQDTVGTINETDSSTFVLTLSAGTNGGFNFSNGSSNAAFNVTGTGTAVNILSAASTLTSTLDLTISDASVTTSTGALQITAVLSGAGGFIKDGAGTASFATAAKTYTGSTVINAGILRTSVAGEANGTTSVTVNSGGTLSLAASSTGQTIQLGTSSTVVTLNGVGATSLQGVASSGDGALNTTSNATTLGNNVVLATDSTILTTATLTLAGTVSGSGALIKAGTSGLTLTGAGSYGGATTINAGTLTAAGASGGIALGGTSAVSINSTGTLAVGAANQFNATTPAPVTFAGVAGSGKAATFMVSANGANQGSTSSVGVGALTLASGSANNVLNFSQGAAVITFASFVPNSAVLTITNYIGTGTSGGTDELVFNEDESGKLADFDFGFGAGVNVAEATLANGFYEVYTTVAVPEPATILGGLLLIGAAGWNQRRRLRGMLSGGHPVGCEA